MAMKLIGFGSIWCGWVMSCASIATTAILVNGSPTREVSMERGLRQGCPFYPILFNIMVEVFSAFMFKAADWILIKGVDVGSSDICVSHLQYVDDTVITCESNPFYLLNTKRLLRCF